MLAGVAWVFVGVVLLLPAGEGLSVALLAVGLGAYALTIGGLVGLYTRQAGVFGWLGATGFSASFAGSVILLTGLVLGTLFAAILPGAVLGAVLVLTRLGPIILGVGLVLLGIATLLARVLPRWCGLALIAFPALWFTGGYGGDLGIALSRMVIGVICLALGYVLWSGRGETEFYVGDLIGVAVYDEAGDLVGSVAEVLEAPTRERILVVEDRDEAYEHQVPFTFEHVPTVDVRRGRIVVKLPVRRSHNTGDTTELG